MKILLSNDDGYFAEGLVKLAKALSREHEVFVCAPASEQSGAGHGLTLGGGLNWRGEAEVGFIEGCDGKRIPCRAVCGSPADAVKFAVQHLYKTRAFDLVMSGVNSVLNIGTDIMYSGTYAAAEEGTILGIPSIAVSTAAKKGGYDAAVDFVVDNLDALIKHIRPFVTLNVNVPFGDKEKLRGVKVTAVGVRHYEDWYEETPAGFRLKGYPFDCSMSDKDDDCKWSDCGYITVTPVRMVSADEESLREMRGERWKL